MSERPDDEQTTASAADTNAEDGGRITGQAVADDPSRAPEEEGESRIPGDPRLPHEQQPPFSELYGEDKAGD